MMPTADDCFSGRDAMQMKFKSSQGKFLGCFYNAIIRCLSDDAYLSSDAYYLLSARTNFNSS